jgi:Ca2+-binding RTX toxin-like protein
MQTFTLTTANDTFLETETPLQQGDAISALAGNDTIHFSTSMITVDGGFGNDQIFVDELGFASFFSVFDGGLGDDTIQVRGRNHVVNGGEGNDDISIFGRDSTLNGGAGDDVLTDKSMRTAGYTSIFNGDAGNDRMVGNGAASTYNGGTGDDTYVILGDEMVVEASNSGIDTVRTSIANYSLNTNFERLVLLSGGIEGSGNTLGNTLIGNSAANTLSGFDGNDSLIGGLGQDRLRGGSGADHFLFRSANEIGKTHQTSDLILDFKHLTDKIDLHLIDASTRKSGNNAFVFIANQNFHKITGELRTEMHNESGTVHDVTYVSGDTNGDGAADFRLEIAGLKILSQTDFIL